MKSSASSAVCGALLLCRGTAAPCSLLPSSFATAMPILLNIPRLWISRVLNLRIMKIEFITAQDYSLDQLSNSVHFR